MKTSLKRKYLKIKQIGSGAFSQVWMVKRRKTGRMWALKQIKVKQLNQQQRKNQHTEIRILSKLNHENIVGYREHFTDSATGDLCIVMELCRGGNMQQHLQRLKKQKRRIPEPEVVDYLRQLAAGLDHLH